MKSRKMLSTILSTEQQSRHEHKEQTFEQRRRRRVWDDSGEMH